MIDIVIIGISNFIKLFHALISSTKLFEKDWFKEESGRKETYLYKKKLRKHAWAPHKPQVSC